MQEARVTTQPSANTGHDGASVAPSHVRWVYPQSAATRLLGTVVVGRESTCGTVLAGHEISRQHAEFHVDGPLVSVRDLGSCNGVFVNGVKRGTSLLAHGDVLRLGEWVGIVADNDIGFGEIAPGWFGSGSLAAIAEPARRLPNDLPVVVQGETGTGKEGMARAIHKWSARSGTFVPVNCAALPIDLAESELFGYRKGAFSGAERASIGLFRSAHRGTLFLDEVLELPLAVQAKLLRAIEQHEVLPLGETSPIRVDVRTVVASQEPLARAVAASRFRADLQARLEGYTVVLPALRTRREDVIPLAQLFLRQFGNGRPPKMEPKFVEALCLYDWPTNVRGVHMLLRALLGTVGHEGLLKKAHLPQWILTHATQEQGESAPKQTKRRWRRTNNEAEFQALAEALRQHEGSVARAAAALGIDRARAYRILSAHPEFSLQDPAVK